MHKGKKTRLLMGIPSPRLKMGGPTTHLPYLVAYFQQHPSYEIRTFSYGSKKDGGAQLDKGEGVISKLINTVSVFFTFLYWVIRFRPHVIHINTAFDRNSVLRDVPFSLFCYLFRFPLVFKLHGSHAQLLSNPGAAWTFLIRLFFAGAQRVGVLSDVEKQEFIRQFGRSHKMVVVKNIVLPLPEKMPRYDLAKEPQGQYGLFVSRIIAGKGLDDLIAALPLIHQQLPDFRLLVAGDGPARPGLEAQARELGVDHLIRWLGLVPNKELPSLLREADLFFFLSHFPEGMPMALVEAMRSGIPVITTPVRFARNYLAEEENALFTAAGDTIQLAAQTHRIFSDADLCLRMRTRNPLLVQQFSMEEVGKEFDRLYSSMKSGSPSKDISSTICVE